MALLNEDYKEGWSVDKKVTHFGSIYSLEAIKELLEFRGDA